MVTSLLSFNNEKKKQQKKRRAKKIDYCWEFLEYSKPYRTTKATENIDFFNFFKVISDQSNMIISTNLNE